MLKGYRLPLAWIALWSLLSLLAYSGDNSEHRLAQALLPPFTGTDPWRHPLGHDAFGRDLLQTVLRGSAGSAGLGMLAVTISSVLATVLGTFIALSPERLRFLLLRSLDVLLAFPSILFALVWASIRGPGWETLIVSLSIGILPSFTRLIYSRTRELLVEEYVLAAQGLGATSTRIVRSHLSPALLSLCAVKVPGVFAQTLLSEATLSFLGVGAPIGRDTWGSLLAQGKDYLLEAPHIALGAGLPLVLTVLSLQVISGRFSEKHFRI